MTVAIVTVPTRSAGNFLAFERSRCLPAVFHLPTRDRFVPAAPWTRRIGREHTPQRLAQVRNRREVQPLERGEAAVQAWKRKTWPALKKSVPPSGG